MRHVLAVAVAIEIAVMLPRAGAAASQITLSVPSPAAGKVVVTVQNSSGKSLAVSLAVDGKPFASCKVSPQHSCGVAWDTTTVSNGSHTVQAVSGRRVLASSTVNVANPTLSTPPHLQAVSPTGAAAGSAGFALGVTGSGFAPGATVLWNGSARTTTYVSANQVAASITAADVVNAATVTITATNPGSGPSNSLPFLVAATSSGYRIDSNVYQVPAIARPALGLPVTDPTFGSVVMRISDPSMGSSLGYRHEYTRLTAFNATGTSVVLINMSTFDYQVIDVATGAVLRTIPTCGNDPSMTWSRSDPDRLIYFCANAIWTYQVSTDTATTLMSFPGYAAVGTGEEGTVSDDWHYAAFFGYDANWNKKAIVVADLWSKVVVASDATIAFGDWVGVSPSGQYVVVQHDDTIHGTRVYDLSLNYLRTLHPDGTHEDFVIDADGQDAIVWYAWSDAQAAQFGDRSVVAKARLSDGQTTVLIDTQWKWGGHVSGIGSRGRPGWVLLSDYAQVWNPPPNTSPFQQEIFWLKMDGSGAVERYAHHHSTQGACGADKDYWAEPHPVASWDGGQILFASIWGAAPCTRYDAYIVR
jgi:hypothetical protein